jgi:hypothetical protein
MIGTIVEGVRKVRPVNCPVTGGHAWQGGNRHLRAEQDDLYEAFPWLPLIMPARIRRSAHLGSAFRPMSGSASNNGEFNLASMFSRSAIIPAGYRGVSGKSKLPRGHPVTLRRGRGRPEPALAPPAQVNPRL